MIVSCPACSTRFEVDESLLGDRSPKLRCGKCRHEWAFQPSDAAEELANPGLRADALKVEPAPRGTTSNSIRPSPPSRRKRSRSPSMGLVIGWALLLVFVTIVLGSALLFRDSVVEAVPQMARLYELVEGPPPPPGAGLTLENVVSVRKRVEGQRVLFIEGEVLNVANRVVRVPDVAAMLVDTEGRQLSVWRITPEAAELTPGESTRFQTSIRDIPPDGANISIDFAQPGRVVPN